MPPFVRRLALFGSRLEGTARADSDIDESFAEQNAGFDLLAELGDADLKELGRLALPLPSSHG